MTFATLTKASIPDHVPEDLVIDFDYFAVPGYENDPHLAWKRVQNESPRIFWTPYYGGHWVATRAREMAELEMDHTLFSHTGISIPRSSMPSLPLESDPPLHTGLRAIISPLFSPPTLKKAENHALAVASNLIEQIAPRGACEFQSDLSCHLPISVFLHITELPQEDAEILLPIADRRVREVDPVKRDAVKKQMIDYLTQVVIERKKRPGDDILSRIIHSKIDGRELTEFELMNMLATIMFGGLDTVASGLGFIMRFLAMNQPARQWLGKQTSIPLFAIDELFRRHSIVSTARLVMRDTEFHGLQLKKGEQVLMPTALIGMDDERFENPMDVRFDRADSANYGTFGSGPHRCPGKNLGRMEARLVLEKWLQHIPDFTLVANDPPTFEMGITTTVTRLPLQWQNP